MHYRRRALAKALRAVQADCAWMAARELSDPGSERRDSDDIGPGITEIPGGFVVQPGIVYDAACWVDMLEWTAHGRTVSGHEYTVRDGVLYLPDDGSQTFRPESLAAARELGVEVREEYPD